MRVVNYERIVFVVQLKSDRNNGLSGEIFFFVRFTQVSKHEIEEKAI